MLGHVAALVDVQLQQAAQPVEPSRRGPQTLGVYARIARRLAQGHPVGVRPVQHVIRVEAPGERPAPEGWGVVAGALLVGEGDHGQGNLAALGDGEARRHAQRAVIASALANAVQV